mmetsp:Transcript_8657/g.18627  ORF Transcript_8657/g.18627 Transcript_8657/m.18627 type:complete len:231 (+) Transcript_8657:123-815(+)|eukprot:CAMPEP_0172529998 /NCGR_PEP_ID=MMETSP1067-20121228/3893_1 /TAXON_ID=265564 ORGANISM="Thalassiosira punctigera, Strain Tpunct2005C2" /NCGR_SAMPLE_ID=MMETSP1067 /ASSEMBLY_ACC=CAM_ASM_000444 /LENGTH=230 /DNA_ID=CAMNT_0013314139 /DNA_START=89 /DNA_END=781 /DNA_ORIENTATION=-
MTSPEASSSPSGFSADALSYLALILNIIESKDWVAFNQVATQNPRAFQVLSEMMTSTDEFNGMSFLHAIVRNHPPLEVVADVIALCPYSPRARDCLNRTPLHVAAGVGASVPVVKYLCMSYPEACKIQDEDGRTPLHFACDVDCKLFEGQPDRHDKPTFEIVHALLSASIAPASMEDEDEMSPLEYAIFSNADVRVVKLLQKAAQKFMKKKAAQEKQDRYQGRRQLGAAA